MHIHKPVTDLIFNVAQLLREETGARRRYTFAEERLPLDEAHEVRKLAGTVQFTRTASGALADVKASGEVEMACIRCLEHTTQPIAVQFRDEFHSRVEVNTGMPLPKPDEEDPFYISENHMLDLGEAIREYGLMELPMRPLCRPDCRGICPQCGADLNLGLCDCAPEPGDERFSALQELLGGLGDQDNMKG